ncbi:hypothetical protein BJV77DRAFT_1064340 [Russula vinacea]|nr:hypothetical protein BJV77DRAFT_1064340 [Russula vinacea]
MSKPPLFPQQSASGIAVDPRTLDRVVPESRRADGSLRKERKIRPGFTPQEDVARFRSGRQQAMDARALPKGHVPGWSPPGAAVPEKKEQLSKTDEDATADPVDKEARTAQVADGTTPPQGQHAQKEEPTGAESGVDAVVDKLDKLAV